MRSEAYTVKLNTETKDKWQELVSGIMKDRGIATIGDVYPVLIDLINESRPVNPELNGYIKNIRANIDAVMKNVIAINGVYQSAVENNEQALNEAKSGLVAQLERESKRNGELTDELESVKKKLEAAKKEISDLKEENQSLKADKETQQAILELLSSLKAKEVNPEKR